MQIEAVSRAVFDSVDDAVKRSFNGTISKRIPLRNIGDWYREIDVSDDAKMLFLRTANQCMPLPFENISGIIVGTKKQKIGEEVHVASGNNWGLTAAAAVFGGWYFLVQQRLLLLITMYGLIMFIYIYLDIQQIMRRYFFVMTSLRLSRLYIHFGKLWKKGGNMRYVMKNLTVWHYQSSMEFNEGLLMLLLKLLRKKKRNK